MKVLLVTNDFPPMGGGEAAWYWRICATVPPSDVVVLAPHIAGDQAFDRAQPYKIYRTKAPTSPNPLLRLIQIGVFFFFALRLVRRHRIDAVHIGHLYLGPVGLGVRAILKTPYIIYLHGGEMAVYLRFRLVRLIVGTIVRRGQTVVVNSHFTAEFYEAMGIRHSRVETLTMSVRGERFRTGLDTNGIRTKYNLNGGRLVLTVGRLVQRKGHDMVLHALDRLPPSLGRVQYVIVGEGPEEGRLRSLTHELGRDEQVSFLGRVPDEDLSQLYAACDVFVLPSRALATRDGIEGFGIVFLEAGASGKPVVGGRSGGISEAVVDGATGILVNPTDVNELADAITRLLQSPQEASRLGAAGRARVLQLDEAWTRAVKRIWGPVGGGN